MNDEKKLLIDCRDAALGYEGRAVSSHLNFLSANAGRFDL